MNSSENLKVALAQMTSTDDVSANLERVRSSYADALAQGADLLVCPENSLFFRIRSGSKVQGVSGEQLGALEKMVRGKTALMITTASTTGSTKFANTTYLIEPGKTARALYEKIHMFDVDVEGAPPVRESEVFTAGEQPRTLEFRGWKIGLSICYDLRFAELYLSYAQKVDLILVPSAFLVPTGEAHWHTLLRARAIECQCFVAAPAQVGAHISGDQSRNTFGHSLVVDPWGRVMLELANGPETRTVELAKDQINKVRRQIPMANHRRLFRA